MQQAACCETPSVTPGAGVLTGEVFTSLGRAPLALFATLAEWQRRADERATLATLADRELQDMGIRRADAEQMARKPFWSR